MARIIWGGLLLIQLMISHYCCVSSAHHATIIPSSLPSTPPLSHQQLIRLINYKNNIYKVVVITNSDTKKIYVTPLSNYSSAIEVLPATTGVATQSPSPSPSAAAAIGESDNNFVSGSTGNKQRVISNKSNGITSTQHLSNNRINQINKTKLIVYNYEERGAGDGGGGDTSDEQTQSHVEKWGDGGIKSDGIADDDDNNFDYGVKDNKIRNNKNRKIRSGANRKLAVKAQPPPQRANNDNHNKNNNDYSADDDDENGLGKVNLVDDHHRKGPPTDESNLHLPLSSTQDENYSNEAKKSTTNKSKRHQDISSSELLLKYRHNFKSPSHYVDTKFHYPSMTFRHPQSFQHFHPHQHPASSLRYSNFPHKIQSTREVDESYTTTRLHSGSPPPIYENIFEEAPYNQNWHHPQYGFGIFERHPPPDPQIQILLSHYGKYLPGSHYWGTGKYGFYSYSAGNDYHNNLPIGEYKRTSEYDQ